MQSKEGLDLSLNCLQSLATELEHSRVLILPSAYNVKDLLLAWSRLCLLKKRISSMRYFSTCDLVMLSLILATVAHILLSGRPTSRRFLDHYDIYPRLKLLTTVELFFASLLVTKQVLDVEEDKVFHVDFDLQHYLLLMHLLSPQCTPPPRFHLFNRAVTSLYLWVVDLDHSLGVLSLSSPPLNTDHKIERYLRRILGRDVLAEDYQYLPELEAFFLSSVSPLPSSC